MYTNVFIAHWLRVGRPVAPDESGAVLIVVLAALIAAALFSAWEKVSHPG
jgi:hypothetical protein